MSEPLRVDANFEAVRALGDWLQAVLEPLGSKRSKVADSIELAVHEMATNSIDHAASSNIEFRALLADRFIEIVVVDDGEPFGGGIGPAPQPDEPQVRGYGLVIVEALTESVDYERTATGNRWTLRFGVDAG